MRSWSCCHSSMKGRSALILASATESGIHETSRTSGATLGLGLGIGIGLGLGLGLGLRLGLGLGLGLG